MSSRCFSEADAEMMSQLKAGHIGPQCCVTLPSGQVVTGRDVDRWEDPNPKWPDNSILGIYKVVDGEPSILRCVLPSDAMIRVGEERFTIPRGQMIVIGAGGAAAAEEWELVGWQRPKPAGLLRRLFGHWAGQR